jgi:uncharacterized membrane protein YfcA
MASGITRPNDFSTSQTSVRYHLPVSIPELPHLPQILLAIVAVLFIGLSKAGFGGGLGMLTTPLCAVAFGAKDAIGILLPLLCAGDAFSLYYYWGKWERRNLGFLLPGVVLGVLIGVHFIGRFSPRQLNIAIGVLAVTFVLFQLGKDAIFRAEGKFAPGHKVGIPCGIAAGITSSFAHGAAPVVAMFLMPQQLPKELFVGTTVLIFTWINWIKMPFFVAGGIIDGHTLARSLWYFPLVPLGVWCGVWLNRRVSQAIFVKLIYLFTFLTGLELILNLKRFWDF